MDTSVSSHIFRGLVDVSQDAAFTRTARYIVTSNLCPPFQRTRYANAVPSLRVPGPASIQDPKGCVKSRLKTSLGPIVSGGRGLRKPDC